MKQNLIRGTLVSLLLLSGFAGCSDDDKKVAGNLADAGAADTGAGGTSGGTAQLPPTGASAVEAWIASGQYKAWACESALHAARAPSPHGKNRICSNKLLSEAGVGEYPVGAAAVKELYSDAGALSGIAVYVHTKAGTTGDTWYWYERVPLDSAAPHNAAGVVADGAGDTGPAKEICVGCHAGAGIDAAHFGHDYVYTQIRPGADSSQTPPEGKAALEGWLASGEYKRWHCEAAAHDARSPSPHGKNRICSNELLSKAGAGEYPVGAASVKELLGADGKVTGYAVARHTVAGTTGGSWYWYERAGAELVADGAGNSGVPMSLCVGCHAGAGSDAGHSGHDMVYTQVQ